MTGNPGPGLGQAQKCGRVIFFYIDILCVFMVE